MSALGELIAQDQFPQGDREQAEGYRHLARLMQYALQWYVEFGDPAFPAFHRFDDDWLKWGGPGADFTYLRAKLDGQYSYRLSGHVAGARGFTFSLCEGEMQMNQMAVFGQWNHRDVTLDTDGKFSCLFSAERPAGYDGDWFPLDPRTDHLNIRIVVADWENDAIPAFYIERVGGAGQAPGPLSGEQLAERLDRAAKWVEATIPYWNQRIGQAFEKAARNRIAQPGSVDGGVQDISYGTGFWELESDEVLLLEWEVPRAHYWGIILYSLGWFESLDIAHRLTSYSDAQSYIDTDGKVRMVIAHSDPGVPNWLDTEGRRTGMIATRWVWSQNNPHPAATVLPLSALRDALPAAHPRVEAGARREQMAARQRGNARRFRR
mgnify:CR=1 FL=1